MPPTPAVETVRAPDAIGATPRLRTRRPPARRWRYRLGIDVGLGLLVALAALRFAGLGAVAVVAIPLLVLCTLSLGIDRMRSKGVSR